MRQMGRLKGQWFHKGRKGVQVVLCAPITVEQAYLLADMSLLHNKDRLWFGVDHPVRSLLSIALP